MYDQTPQWVRVAFEKKSFKKIYSSYAAKYAIFYPIALLHGYRDLKKGSKNKKAKQDPKWALLLGGIVVAELADLKKKIKKLNFDCPS